MDIKVVEVPVCGVLVTDLMSAPEDVAHVDAGEESFQTGSPAAGILIAGVEPHREAVFAVDDEIRGPEFLARLRDTLIRMQTEIRERMGKPKLIYDEEPAE